MAAIRLRRPTIAIPALKPALGWSLSCPRILSCRPSFLLKKTGITARPQRWKPQTALTRSGALALRSPGALPSPGLWKRRTSTRTTPLKARSTGLTSRWFHLGLPGHFSPAYDARQRALMIAARRAVCASALVRGGRTFFANSLLLFCTVKNGSTHKPDRFSYRQATIKP